MIDDDAPLDPALRATLMADDDRPTDEQRVRLAQRLSVTTGVTFDDTPHVAVRRAGGRRVWKQLVAAAAVFAAGIGIGVAIDRMRSRAPAVAAAGMRDAGRAPVGAAASAADAPGEAAPDPAADAALDAPRDASPRDAAAHDARAPVDAARRSLGVAVPADASVSADQLARERGLLEVARSALRTGDLRLATKNLVEHELRYPEGALREERQVLQIELAVARGDASDAARRAAQFRREFPSSVFAARVDELVPR